MQLPPISSRPQPKYRRSFLETFLARQQNKEVTSTVANTSRLLNPINHLPRPTPVHLKQTLLTLPEQRRSRQNSPNSPTFQESFEPGHSNRSSIGLPSNRASAQSGTPSMSNEKEKPLPASPPSTKPPSRQNTGDVTLQSKLAQTYGFSEADQPSHPPRRVNSQRSLHHVRSLTSMHSNQLANVPPLPSSPLPRSTTQNTPTQTRPPSTRDLEAGLSAPEEPSSDEEPPWGPSHPCFPHLNPHVPLSSPLYNSTRIIRIRRDWMVVGDLAPTFSNIYPEILDPLLPEPEFRNIINHINSTLMHAYNPYGVANWIDGILGFLTGWFWENFRPGGIKGELRKLEAWIEEWNRTVGHADGVKVIGLRRTGYLCLDIQIPDPQVRVVRGDETPRAADSRG